MRAFIAIDLPEKVKTSISSLQNNLKELNLSAKWVRPDNIHLTLKFLGNISDDKLTPVKEIIANIAKEFKTFEVNLTELGFFPNSRKPRVLFIATSKSEKLKAIADSLEEGLAKIGFVKEGRFKSHLTLARIKSLENISHLNKKITSLRIQASFKIDQITLYQSKLTSSGPVYEKLFTAQLS